MASLLAAEQAIRRKTYRAPVRYKTVQEEYISIIIITVPDPLSQVVGTTISIIIITSNLWSLTWSKEDARAYDGKLSLLSILGF